MMKEEEQNDIIRYLQHEVRQLKLMYRAGKIDVLTLSIATRPLERAQHYIHRSFKNK
jgi:hypothetical protein